jgi:hypothetical protein
MAMSPLDGAAAAAAAGAAPGVGLGVDPRDHLVARHRAAVADDVFGDHAGGGRRHLEHDLVGLDLDHDLVHRHGLPGLLLPLQQGRFGDRLRQLRDLDVYDSHLLLSVCSITC